MNQDEHTNKIMHLAVDKTHKLWVHDWGNIKSKAIFIHLQGGPGGATQDSKKTLFDPKIHRVIFYDQRGAGQSTPAGSLVNNTTNDLIEDIKLITEHFKLDKFTLVGGSWGSCLALAYALKYPKNVKALVISGIYTGSQKDTDFINKGEFKNWYPDVWQTYLSRTPKQYHDNPSAFHYKNLKSNNFEDVKKSAYALSEMERSLLSIDDRTRSQSYDEFDPSASVVEFHYLANKCFMEDDYIIDNASRLKMPVWIVQGRYDMVCPPSSAYNLHSKLPNSQLIWTIAGHKMSDRNNFEVIRSLLLSLK